MTKNLRIISDVHGKYDQYLGLTNDCDYSLQLGDMGFDYSHMNNLDYNVHKFFKGNHDHYDWNYVPHDLGNFGTHKFKGVDEIFFVRGGFSLDWSIRTYGIDLWSEEELNFQQRKDATELYKTTKPNFMVTHECPLSIVDRVIGKDNQIARNWGYDDAVIKTQTNTMLQDMLEFNPPKTWVHGHYHKHFDQVIDNTRFICLPELGYIDFEF